MKFAAAKVRPAAQEADAERAIAPELLAQANELGVNMLGIPEELGGVMHEQAATTTALVGEALAHGDMGIAYAVLAPGAVATAIGHWGSADMSWSELFIFTLLPRELSDFAEMCDFQQYSHESHFTKGKLCSIMTAGGRKTLTDSKFIVSLGGEKSEIAIEDEAHFYRVLNDEFAIQQIQ